MKSKVELHDWEECWCVTGKVPGEKIKKELMKSKTESKRVLQLLCPRSHSLETVKCLAWNFEGKRVLQLLCPRSHSLETVKCLAWNFEALIITYNTSPGVICVLLLMVVELPNHSSLAGPIPKSGMCETNFHLSVQPFQPIVSPSAGAIAGWMETNNPSMPHGAIAAGPPGIVQPPVASAFIKHPRTPPGGLGSEYQMTDSEHSMKRNPQLPLPSLPGSGAASSVFFLFSIGAK
ncbi:LIS1 homology motif protein [Artemisia annua]|uniref:LIS1 homology motif protein n=1 Tax=Artemisia annua TaxID=35608 RepID=A0A2U1LVD5_ARTAN|nr:LIS1 homology motif protein [Artemisia annua]